MKNLFLAGFLSVLVFSSTSCLKDSSCNNKSAASEEAAILNYASSNNMAGTLDPSSGLYYEILNAGAAGTKPTLNSRIFIRYTGKLLTGQQFDGVSDHTLTGWVLGGLIPGWQLGLQQIGEGGHIRLIVPSSLAYGCGGYGPIPGNSILFFDVELVDVQ